MEVEKKPTRSSKEFADGKDATTVGASESKRSLPPTGSGRAEPTAAENVRTLSDSGSFASTESDSATAAAVEKKYPGWEHLLAIVGVLVASAFLASLIFFLLGLDKNLSDGFRTLVTYIIQMALPIAFILWQRRKAGLSRHIVRLAVGRANPALVLWGVVLLVVSSVVLEPLLALFPDKYLEMLNAAVGTGGWAILTTVVVAPIMEEVLFRGLILGSLRERGNALRAVVVSSLIFGVIHVIPQQVINAFVVGLILGLVYVRTGSLLAVILIHALNNAVAYIQSIVLQDNTTMRDLIGNSTVYWICYALCVVVLLASLAAMIRFSGRKKIPAQNIGSDNNTAL